jgi:hypothetical protein
VPNKTTKKTTKVVPVADPTPKKGSKDTKKKFESLSPTTSTEKKIESLSL